MLRDPHVSPAEREQRAIRGQWRAIERRARQDDSVLATAWLVGELGPSEFRMPVLTFPAFELADGRTIERDCHWPRQRVVLELDGRATHDTARAFEKDRRDDALLLAQGVVTVRATWVHLHAGQAQFAGVLWRVLDR